MVEVQLLVGEGDTSSTTGRTFQRRNPITGEVVSRAAAATPEDGCAAVDAAARAFATWSATGPSERRAKLMKAADLLEQRLPQFAEFMTAELGATGPWAAFNVWFAAQILREAAALTTQVKGEVIPSDVPGCLAMAIRQPVGVVLSMAPWNAPVILGIRALAVPLACGNTVVFKASELCPATHRLIGEVLREAGLGAGVVNVVTHAPEDAAAVVEAMVAQPVVKRVNFTGSSRVGKIIAAMTARYLKPTVLELGGKAPLVIFEDADLDEAVRAAAFGAFANQGQICMSTERVLVHAKVADEFVEKFSAKSRNLSFGDPQKGGAILGAVVDRSTVERVKRLVQDAVARGAKVVLDGASDSTIMPPIIVDHVTRDMDIFREESFGPSVSVTRFQTDEEAIDLANDTEYGLSAAVFSRDIGRALSVAKRIHSGICHINSTTVHDEAQMPFGGVKASGYGRFGGNSSIQEFTELRWITIQTGQRHYPF